MLPKPDFAQKDRPFWAHVRLVSEKIGYAKKRTKKNPDDGLRRFDPPTIMKALTDTGLRTDHLLERGSPTPLAQDLLAYLNYRAEILERHAPENLMTREQALELFTQVKNDCPGHQCCLPMNKQKKEKRHEAYLTCIVNLLAEKTLGGVGFDDNPRNLISISKDGIPVRTFSRWMDGAYPAISNPDAVWEVKEYYGTTTFGSRVADGVYETMLDGEELAEYRNQGGYHIRHYLIIDDRFTWWVKGKSYLCRIIDMLHMGLVDEVLFGREVLTRWPEIVKTWPTT